MIASSSIARIFQKSVRGQPGVLVLRPELGHPGHEVEAIHDPVVVEQVMLQPLLLLEDSLSIPGVIHFQLPIFNTVPFLVILFFWMKANQALSVTSTASLFVTSGGISL